MPAIIAWFIVGAVLFGVTGLAIKVFAGAGSRKGRIGTAMMLVGFGFTVMVSWSLAFNSIMPTH